MLGRGLSSLHCRYHQTFFGNSEPGYYIAIDGEIFKMWKAKLKRFEEKNLQKANNMYRINRRNEKTLAAERMSGAPSRTIGGSQNQRPTPVARQKYNGGGAQQA